MAVLVFPAFAAEKLVVISISGLDYRYLRDADKLRLKIPVLRKLEAQGANADGVAGVSPTTTWASATTLITGVPPTRHQIVDNGHADQVSKAETLWQAAAYANLKTASLFWPATLGANINFTCPEIRTSSLETNVPFEPIAERCTPALVARMASVSAAFRKPIWNDETAMAGLVYLLKYEQPDLSLVQVIGVDAEQRGSGALSIYSRDLLETIDEMLGQVVASLPAHAVLAVVSDHGFETEEHIVRPRVLANSQAVEVRFGVIGTRDVRVAATLRGLIGNRRTGIAREIPMVEVRLAANQSTKELSGWVAAFGTMPGYIATEESKPPAVSQGSRKGIDNLWPSRANYRSVFVLWGAEVKHVHLGEISILQIAPTLASVLGVTLPEAKQASLWPTIAAKAK